MNTLITNATVVTGDREGMVIHDGAVAVRDDRIAAVDTTAVLGYENPDLPVLDATGKAVLPGLINAHTHPVLTVMRGVLEDLTGVPTGPYVYNVPLSYLMTDDERSVMAALGCIEAIRSGTTALLDTTRYVHTYAQAMADTGLRLFLSEGCFDADPDKLREGVYEENRAWGESLLERATRLIDGFHGATSGRVEVQVAAHATDNCSPWMLSQLLALGEKQGLRRTLHFSQSPSEVEVVQQLREMTPGEYLRQNGWIGPELQSAHWTAAVQSDIEMMAEAGAHMAQCPPVLRRGMQGGADMNAIFDAGVNVSLGTDAMVEDMFRAMRWGMLAYRGKRGPGSVHPLPAEMLEMATRKAARGLGREDDLGSLERGKKADLIIVDIERPHLAPVTNLVTALVHYGQASDVESVMVDGEWVMRDRVIASVNEEETIRNAREATRSAWRRFGKQYPQIPLPPMSEMEL